MPRGQQTHCGKCGGKVPCRTLGCSACATRHSMYKRNGDPRYMPPPPKLCSGCGCDSEEYTDGCKACRMRSQSRVRRGDPLGIERPKRCKGCGVLFDEFTPGCKPCSNRKSRRKKRLRERKEPIPQYLTREPVDMPLDDIADDGLRHYLQLRRQRIQKTTKRQKAAA